MESCHTDANEFLSLITGFHSLCLNNLKSGICRDEAAVDLFFIIIIFLFLLRS